ncbi:MAG TPA: hypothetical protein VMG35_19390 [Bryobacteraceae bacterium]|nr:hypothetical protein [Bryobacteraceae bacterium]
MASDEAINRLARQIDAARKSERFMVNPEEVAELRRQGACALHQICVEFVSSLNSKLSQSVVDLSPATYAPEMFRPSDVNLIQISSQGRQMQIMFQATPQLFSMEKFRVPYVLEGEVRTYNQGMLERFEIRSRLLFFCLDEDAAVWRFFDWRGPRTAVVDGDLLASLMGQLF